MRSSQDTNEKYGIITPCSYINLSYKDDGFNLLSGVRVVKQGPVVTH